MTQFKVDVSDSESENIGGFKTKDVVGNVKFKRRNKNAKEGNKCSENHCDQKNENMTDNSAVSLVGQSTTVKTKCCSVV